MSNENVAVEAVEEEAVVTIEADGSKSDEEIANTIDSLRESGETVEALKHSDIQKGIEEGKAVVVESDVNLKASILWGLMQSNQIDHMIILSGLVDIVESITIVGDGMSVKYRDGVNLMQMSHQADKAVSE